MNDLQWRVVFRQAGWNPSDRGQSRGDFRAGNQLGGKPITCIKYGGTQITVDREAKLPQELQEEIGY